MLSEKYKLLAKDIILFGIGTIGSKLIMFLLLPIYTNALTTDEYGIADLVFSFSEIIRPFISLAIYNGLLRYGLSKECDRDEVFKCASVIFLLGTLVSFLITPLFGFYKAISDWKWYMTVYAIIVFASKNVLIYLKVSDKNKLYSVLSIVQALVLALSNVLLLVVLKLGIQGYLIANMFAPAFIVVIGFFTGGAFKGLRTSRYNGKLMSRMVVYSLPFIVNDISWWLIHSSDKFMIERFMDASALGIYSAASKIPLLVSVVAGIFSQAWDISVVKEYENENDNKYYEKIFKYFVVFVNGISIVLISIIKPFMKIYVGEGFRDAWMYVPLLLSAAVFYTLDIFTISFFAAMKKSKTIMWPTIIGSTLNVGLNYIFINKYGIWGAIIGTIGAYLFMMIVHYYMLHRMMRFDLHIGLLAMNCLLTFVMALLVGRDFNVLMVVLLGIATYFVINLKDIRDLTARLITIVKRKAKR